MQSRNPVQIIERYCDGSYCRILSYVTIGVASLLLVLTIVSALLALPI